MILIIQTTRGLAVMAKQGKEKSVSDLLRERGFGHRNVGRPYGHHEIFNLRNGEPVANLTAHDAAELLADSSWRAA